jgi:hypothetical protein
LPSADIGGRSFFWMNASIKFPNSTPRLAMKPALSSSEPVIGIKPSASVCGVDPSYCRRLTATKRIFFDAALAATRLKIT